MKNIKLDILAFGAHPDDVELGCGGTIAKEISNGKKVGIIDLTRGELGTRGSAEIRDSESNNSSAAFLFAFFLLFFSGISTLVSLSCFFQIPFSFLPDA